MGDQGRSYDNHASVQLSSSIAYYFPPWFSNAVKEVAISEFKAKCLSLLEEVQKTKKPLLVTKFGKPIAEVNPPSLHQKSRSWLGSMKGEIKFLGDIVSTVFDERDWQEPSE